MKRSYKIKARKRIENGCNFPSLMTISKYPWRYSWLLS